MSRTDRDAPSWARATWWAPLHRCAALYTSQYPGHAHHTGSRRPLPPGTGAGPQLQRAFAPPAAWCDLPAGPDLRQFLARGHRTNCTWRPCDDRLPRMYDGPTRAFVLATWTRPQRARVRDKCRLAVQQHRATGSVDITPPTADHRHAARWHW
ncbi:hypothetical protein AB0H83_39825 [Dactylosporangium sp. NPDC050688]|uniref:hypothetical protein n=1 Tax=Dactylosporangium sp. NPDC050688 TaxID=3157217 RepID=UPI0034079CE2